jgi:hypothetical protein
MRVSIDAVDAHGTLHRTGSERGRMELLGFLLFRGRCSSFGLGFAVGEDDLGPGQGAAARISDGAAQRCRGLPRSQAAHAPGETRQDQRRGYELRENRLPGCTTGRGQHSVPSNQGITILTTE